MKKNLLYCILILSLSMLLTSCLDAAISGAQAAYNHHSIKKSLNDKYTTLRAERAIYIDSTDYKDTNVAVATFNNTVLLAGQIPTQKQRTEIEKIVNNIPGVEKVYNLTTLSQPTSSLTRLSDTWITTKVKAQLISMEDIDPSQIKVVTEDGTVFLMGIIPPEQAQIAVDIARNTEGVQNVVKIFSYLRISKT